jgi:hypothetical protein
MIAVLALLVFIFNKNISSMLILPHSNLLFGYGLLFVSFYFAFYFQILESMNEMNIYFRWTMRQPP